MSYRLFMFGTLLSLGLNAVSINTQAAIVQFDVQGRSGTGLLGGNENPGVTGGSGGETSPGIFFDDALNLLTINVGWGSVNGFTDLTGNATVMHIHQSTGFTENGGTIVSLHPLAGFNNSATSGGFSGTVTLTDPNEVLLFQNRLYLNVHTTANANGEIRGNLVAVPEPASIALIALMGLPFAIARLRSRRRQS